MTKMFIQKRLNQLEQNRLIGKPGLSIDEVRESQVKLRFTNNEIELLTMISELIGSPRAVISNVLLMDGVIDLLASDPELYDDVVKTWGERNMPKLDLFQEVNRRSKTVCIEGTFYPVSDQQGQDADKPDLPIEG
ncbi:hypothetical protein [Grimontia marina]|uniref:Uncharacterized protein n=1 Tax=Grimontia marina TaxID=646534 RepID=A0A128EZU7_9GAMM|nr:hypothetical protein [Grimontia marina]CZF79670.1 hypothetical protein GMA8713_01075 [Grimontia marina]